LPEWEDFLERALVFDPRKRMTIDDALGHPIFKDVRREEDFQFG
jgi:serine/threonine protein kinase